MFIFDSYPFILVFAANERQSALIAAVRQLEAGRPVQLLPAEAELALDAAADFLNVSFAYMGQLLDEGRFKFRGSGGRARFVRADALASFRRAHDEKRSQLLDQMTAQAQADGAYDVT